MGVLGRSALCLASIALPFVLAIRLGDDASPDEKQYPTGLAKPGEKKKTPAKDMPKPKAPAKKSPVAPGAKPAPPAAPPVKAAPGAPVAGLPKGVTAAPTPAPTLDPTPVPTLQATLPAAAAGATLAPTPEPTLEDKADVMPAPTLEKKNAIGVDDWKKALPTAKSAKKKDAEIGFFFADDAKVETAHKISKAFSQDVFVTRGNNQPNRVVEQPEDYDQKLTPEEEMCLKVTPSLGSLKDSCKLNMVLGAAKNLEGVQGDIVEGGVADGAGILPVIFYLGCTGDLRNRTVHLFDTWGGAVQRAHMQGDAVQEDDVEPTFKEGWYKRTLKEFEANAKAFGTIYDRYVFNNSINNASLLDWETVWEQVTTHRGAFSEAMPDALGEIPSDSEVAFLMCDGDQYQATKECLEVGGKHVVKGGLIYNDDYFAYSECNKAVEEYFEADPRKKTDVFIMSDQAPCKFTKAKGCTKPKNDDAPTCTIGCGQASVVRMDEFVKDPEEGDDDDDGGKDKKDEKKDKDKKDEKKKDEKAKDAKEKQDKNEKKKAENAKDATDKKAKDEEKKAENAKDDMDKKEKRWKSMESDATDGAKKNGAKKDATEGSDDGAKSDASPAADSAASGEEAASSAASPAEPAAESAASAPAEEEAAAAASEAEPEE